MCKLSDINLPSAYQLAHVPTTCCLDLSNNLLTLDPNDDHACMALHEDDLVCLELGYHLL